ncbi:unnamed protein product, partial [Phaeothamnion confervicola]
VCLPFAPDPPDPDCRHALRNCRITSFRFVSAVTCRPADGQRQHKTLLGVSQKAVLGRRRRREDGKAELKAFRLLLFLVFCPVPPARRHLSSHMPIPHVSGTENTACSRRLARSRASVATTR